MTKVDAVDDGWDRFGSFENTTPSPRLVSFAAAFHDTEHLTIGSYNIYRVGASRIWDLDPQRHRLIKNNRYNFRGVL
jgi:hypothetical protein